jgi:radical SAM protein with 4Fe4S-binding SPASM domain
MSKIVRALQQCSKRVCMQTNGINLDSSYLKFLPTMRLGFSIDGYRDLYKIYRGNHYDRVIDNLKTANAMGFKTSVLSVITKDTVKNADKFMQWCMEIKDYGVDIHTFKYIHGSDELNKEDQESFVDKCIEYEMVKSLQFAKKNICINKGNDCLYYEFDIDGSVYACNKDYGTGGFANWKEDDIKIIKEKRLNKYIDTKLDDQCKDCPVWLSCKGGCPADRNEGIAIDCYSRLYFNKLSEINR